MSARPAKKTLFALSLALLFLIHIKPATASEMRIELAGHVPIMCRAEIDLDDGPGRIEEFCNNPAGYEVYLDHGRLAAPTSVTVDGVTLALSGAAPTLISSSDRTAIRSRSIAFDVPPGSRLAVRVVPR